MVHRAHSEQLEGVPVESQKTSGADGNMKWAIEPFNELMDRTEHQGQLLHLSMKGISLLCAVPRVVEVLGEVDGREQEPSGRISIDQAKSEAAFAQREINEGFPLLHAFAALGLWSSLETAVRLFAVRWMQNQESAMQIEPIQKIKVRICEYESLQGEDRFFYILERLEQEASIPQRLGVNRFEAVLQLFGLSGLVPDSVQRDLFELNQIRNCLMHRSGKADRRLMEACPWLNLQRGQTVFIDHRTVGRYFQAVVTYATEVICRIGEHFGKDMKAHRPTARSELPSATDARVQP